MTGASSRASTESPPAAAPAAGEAPDRSLRAYSKKHRVYVFREFLIETYGDYLQQEAASSSSTQPVVLDIAGGKGDLSWLLQNVDDWNSVVVDPRRTIDRIERSVHFLRERPEECATRAVRHEHTYQPIAALMPQLQAKDYRMKSPTHLRLFVDQELVETLRSVLLLLQKTKAFGQDDEITSEHDSRSNNQSTSYQTVWSNYWDKAMRRSEKFVTPTGKNDVVSLEEHNSTTNTIQDAEQALEVLLQTRLVLGFHPDQATDYCFELASLLQVPVCVVPCCVFPSEFPHRQLRCDDDSCCESSSNSESKSVEKYHDLLQYLRQEYPDALTATLPFVGTNTARNIVLYTLPTTATAATNDTSLPFSSDT